MRTVKECAERETQEQKLVVMIIWTGDFLCLTENGLHFPVQNWCAIWIISGEPMTKSFTKILINVPGSIHKQIGEARTNMFQTQVNSTFNLKLKIIFLAIIKIIINILFCDILKYNSLPTYGGSVFGGRRIHNLNSQIVHLQFKCPGININQESSSVCEPEQEYHLFLIPSFGTIVLEILQASTVLKIRVFPGELSKIWNSFKIVLPGCIFAQF